MKTTIKGIELKKAIELVKPFVGSLKMKTAPRPILKTALINNEYVIATDSHRLIRIKHNQEVTEPYLHRYKAELSQYESVSSYPDISRLLPDKYNAQQEFKVNVTEWIEAHELGLVAAKEHRNVVINLENDKLNVNPAFRKAVKGKASDYSNELKMKGYKDVAIPEHEQIAYKYILDKDTNIEKVAYNCEYMLTALKVFKKLKEKEVTCYFYGPMRPMYFVSDSVEVLILPVRTY
jgi:DNA polymerase III sliding clamp (beta) subunit (PCNA family)